MPEARLVAPFSTDPSMELLLLALHAMIVIALIGVVLVQRSDGGALGLGGGGGGFMTSRGAANVLTRTTSVLAALFFATSIALALIAKSAEQDTDIIEDLTGEQIVDPTKPLTTDDLLNTLGTGSGAAPATPAPGEAAPELSATPVEAAPTEAAPEAATAPEATEPESEEGAQPPPQR